MHKENNGIPTLHNYSFNFLKHFTRAILKYICTMYCNYVQRHWIKDVTFGLKKLIQYVHCNLTYKAILYDTSLILRNVSWSSACTG